MSLRTVQVSARPAGTRIAMSFILMITVLVAVFILAVCTGSVKISVAEVFQTLIGRGEALGLHSRILTRIRFPRVIAAMAGGVALSLSGLLLQILFNNPIADPYVLGISSGARLSVGFMILGGVTFGFSINNPWLLFFGALIGALGVMAIILFLATKVKSVTTLLLGGIMLGYLCSAVVGVLIVFSDDADLANFTRWTMGSFNSMSREKATVLLVVSITFMLMAFLLSKHLNAMLLGESYAKTMGVNVRLLRFVVILFAGVLTAVVTAFAGLIGFIGMAVPHIARMIQRTSDNRILLPSCALLGAILSTLCDVIARTVVAPTELALGTVTSFIGVPIVMFLLLNRRTTA